MKPREIEDKSFAIITEEIGDTPLLAGYESVIKRVIHTSADFDYLQTITVSGPLKERIKQGFEGGLTIVTDTTMALSGINKPALKQLGGTAVCFIGDESVAAEAKATGKTRSYVSMKRAAKIPGPVLFVIGNAPTALFSLIELIEEGFEPVGVIGVPVGFVNVVESKEALLASGVSCLVAKGRKGGSNIAAAIVNAFMYDWVARE